MIRKVVILGGGESGIGAGLFSAAKGYDTFLSERGVLAVDAKSALLKHKISFEEGGHTPDKVFTADIIVKSPGIPDHVPLLMEAKLRSIEVVSEIEWASRHTKKPVIAVTGTNGKTTTTSLIHHFLTKAGVKAGVGGNIGYSFARLLLNESDYEVFVLEVSSFQLDDCFTFRPHIAALTNITPDHLDRYGYEMKNYVEAKFRMAQAQRHNDYFIYKNDDSWVSKRVKTVDNTQCLEIDEHGPELNMSSASIRGRHNEANIKMAALAAILYGIKQDEVEQALPSFTAEKHRLQWVLTHQGAAWYNDSKATNVDAVFYALDSFTHDIIWIAGGVDKGNDYSMIDDLVSQRVKLLISLGKDNKPLEDFFEDKVPVKRAYSMDEAVSIASQNAGSGDTVLLSPACASFDLFKNYEERGNQFIETVKSKFKSVTL